MKNLVKELKKVPLDADNRSRVTKSLPETPGVYIFFKNEVPIYVGKAVNLKRRIRTYFDLDLEPKTKRMVTQANFLSWIKVDSELESLLLEARLIRGLMPHYNIQAKDDKHPLYIIITKEEFPRVLSVRKQLAIGYDLMASFGPFPSSRNVHSVLRMLRKIFPYSDHKIGQRACIYSHIGLCNPCPNVVKITNDTRQTSASKLQMTNMKNKYSKNIRNLKSVLDGKIDKVKKSLVREMEKLSKSEDFEGAAHVRDQIEKLEYITRPQIPSDYFIQNPNLYQDQRSLEIKELKNLLVNCKLKIENCTRIECYDVSHLSGTNPTASMVTFIDGVADKTFYRHFKIKNAKVGDDYDAMREVARRRLKYMDDPTSPSLLAGKAWLRGAGWGKPDLIIVDGGPGQVKAFVTVLYNTVTRIPVVGIAKNPDRLIVGEEKIRLSGPALNLVQRMRDEAHRFARRYHHKLVSKSFKSTVSS